MCRHPAHWRLRQRLGSRKQARDAGIFLAILPIVARHSPFEARGIGLFPMNRISRPLSAFSQTVLLAAGIVILVMISGTFVWLVARTNSDRGGPRSLDSELRLVREMRRTG